MSNGLRDRFTDEEWDLYKAGKCCYQTAYGTGMGGTRYCGRRSDRASHMGYCGPHERQVQEDYGR